MLLNIRMIIRILALIVDPPALACPVNADRSVELNIFLIHNLERESILVLFTSMGAHFFSVLAVRENLS